MLYGTRKQLNKTLKRAFGDNEKFALLVWTHEAVMAQAEGMAEGEAWNAGRDIPAAVVSGLNDVSALRFCMAGSEHHE